MAFIGKPKAPRPPSRNVGIESYLMAYRMQLSCEIEDVKPPGARDRYVEPSCQRPALWLGSLWDRRIRVTVSRMETKRSR